MRKLLVSVALVCALMGCSQISKYDSNLDIPSFSPIIKNQIKDHIDKAVKVGSKVQPVKGDLGNVELLGVQIADAVKVLFGDVLKVPYVMQGDIADSDNRVDIRIHRRMKKSDLVRVVHRTLNIAGIQVQEREGVYYISVLKEGELLESDVSRVVKVTEIMTGDIEQVVTVLNTVVKKAMGVEFVADKGSGLIIYSCLDRDIAKIEAIISQLDRNSGQVFVEVQIIEYSREGVLLNGLYGLLEKQIDNFSAAFSIGSKDFFSGISKISILKDSGEFSGVLGILEREGIVRNIASPFLIMQSGKESIIKMGDEIPTLGKTSTSDGIQNQDIVYRSTGISVNLIPKVIGKSIYFDVDISTSSGEVNRLSDIQSPTISNRQIKTSFVVQPEQSVLIGGITKEKELKNREGLPYFRRWWAEYVDQNEKSKQKTELLVYLRPVIIDSNEDILQIKINSLKE